MVGCSRSGTTLLLSRLAGHPAVYAFPETGLFLRLFGMRGIPSLPALLGLSLGREQKSLHRALGHDPQNSPEGRLQPVLSPPRAQLCLRAALREGIHFLDQVAHRDGRAWWVEKTPRHYLHARLITEQVPNARVIHILRDGADVVASIVDRARRYPEQFPRQRDPRYAITQWNRALTAHHGCWGRAGHLFLLYEDLVAEPERELTRLAYQCGLPWDPALIEGATTGAAFVLPDEAWKQAAVGPIQTPNEPREPLFDVSTRRVIENALDRKGYQSLVGKIRSAAAEIGVRIPPRSGTNGFSPCAV